MDGTSISVIVVSSRLLLFDTAEVEMTASLLSRRFKGSFSEDSRSKTTDSRGWDFLATSILSLS